MKATAPVSSACIALIKQARAESRPLVFIAQGQEQPFRLDEHGPMIATFLMYEGGQVFIFADGHVEMDGGPADDQDAFDEEAAREAELDRWASERDASEYYHDRYGDM